MPGRTREGWAGLGRSPAAAGLVHVWWTERLVHRLYEVAEQASLGDALGGAPKAEARFDASARREYEQGLDARLGRLKDHASANEHVAAGEQFPRSSGGRDAACRGPLDLLGRHGETA